MVPRIRLQRRGRAGAIFRDPHIPPALLLGPFETTLALRYLRGAQGRDERRGFLRFVVISAIAGVAVGTGALLLAMMIVRGFSREIEAKIVGFGQHVQVESYLGDPLMEADSVTARLRAVPGVVSAQPAIVDFALLRAKGADGDANVDGTLLWGTAAEAQPFISDRTEGSFAFGPDSLGRPGLVVGARFAERLGLKRGDTVTAFSTRGLGAGMVASRPRVKVFHVAGIFETGLGDFDDRFAYTDIGEVQRLFAYNPGEVTRIDLTLSDRTMSRQVATSISEDFGPPYIARPIEEVYFGLFAWVKLQKSIVPLVISILVIVAAFNIIGALLMIVLEKAREIGTVLAMGASKRAVQRLFVFLGFLVGVVGATIGAAVALAFGFIQGTFHLIPLPSDAYYLDSAPVEIQLFDVLWTVLIAIALCTLAAYLPARAASRIEPIHTIRFGA